VAPPALTLVQLLAACCAALNEGRDHDALRLVDEIARRTGRHVQISPSRGGVGISIIGHK
jgi:hypothetical protein